MFVDSKTRRARETSSSWRTETGTGQIRRSRNIRRYQCMRSTSAGGHVWDRNVILHKKVSYREQIAGQHSCHKIFGQDSRRGRLCKKFPSNVVLSPCKIWLLFLLPRARMYRRSRETFSTLVYRPLRIWPWLTPTNTPILHLSYRAARFWSLYGRQQGVPQILGTMGPRPLRWGVSDPLETLLLHIWSF